MKPKTYLPSERMHTPRTKRGSGRGLGKPVYKDGKRVGQNFMMFDEHGRSSNGGDKAR